MEKGVNAVLFACLPQVTYGKECKLRQSNNQSFRPLISQLVCWAGRQAATPGLVFGGGVYVRMISKQKWCSGQW